MSVLECLWCFSSKSVKGILIIINESHIVFSIVDSAIYSPPHRASLVKRFCRLLRSLDGLEAWSTRRTEFATTSECICDETLARISRRWFETFAYLLSW